MIVLVVSDFHLGKGRFFRSGDLNVLEDFHEDERWLEFLEYYSTDRFEQEHVHLVLNGDILNLIQIDVDGVFTPFIDEDLVCQFINKIAIGHEIFFRALARFLSRPNKEITYIVGNHDAGLIFKKAQILLKVLIGEKLNFGSHTIINGVYVEHGHRFDPLNYIAEEDQVRLFVGRKVLNLPWGSLFCLSLLPLLKKKIPYIDKVRPLSSYVRWLIIHDTMLAIELMVIMMRYFISTSFGHFKNNNENFKTTYAVLKQVSIFPKLGKIAQKIFEENRSVHTVVIGHSHLSEWRRFHEGKYYYNSGTWNILPSMDLGQHESVKKLSYVYVEMGENKTLPIKSGVMSWFGNWKPFVEDVMGRF